MSVFNQSIELRGFLLIYFVKHDTIIYNEAHIPHNYRLHDLKLHVSSVLFSLYNLAKHVKLVSLMNQNNQVIINKRRNAFLQKLNLLESTSIIPKPEQNDQFISGNEPNFICHICHKEDSIEILGALITGHLSVIRGLECVFRSRDRGGHLEHSTMPYSPSL